MIYGQWYMPRYANFFILQPVGTFGVALRVVPNTWRFRYLHLRKIKTETYGANLGRKQQVSTCLNRVVFLSYWYVPTFVLTQALFK